MDKPRPKDFCLVVNIKTDFCGIETVRSNSEAYELCKELEKEIKRHCENVGLITVYVENEHSLPQVGEWNRKEWDR